MKRTIFKRRKRRGGFTLFEVLLVLVILIILTSSVSYYVIGAQKKANQRAARAQIGLYESMLTDFHIDVGRYPTSEEGLTALRTPPEGVTKWAGPYANKDIPKDPWGNDYRYALTGSSYQISSPGEDGQDGTADDISN